MTKYNINNEKKGFIISGYRSEVRIETNQVMVPVLADNLEDALAAAESSDILFRPSGAITEEQLKNELLMCMEHRKENPESNEIIHIVAGYFGDPSSENGRTMIVQAKNTQEAMNKALEADSRLHIAGCITEIDVAGLLGTIAKLRKSED